MRSCSLLAGNGIAAAGCFDKDRLVNIVTADKLVIDLVCYVTGQNIPVLCCLHLLLFRVGIGRRLWNTCTTAEEDKKEKEKKSGCHVSNGVKDIFMEHREREPILLWGVLQPSVSLAGLFHSFMVVYKDVIG